MAELGREVLMGIIKWAPFAEFNDFEERLHRLVRTENEGLMFGEWTPAVDIKEAEKEYVVTADLPDVKREEVKVSFNEGVLTLEGEKKLEKEEKTERFHRIERGYGKFVRRFALPNEVDADHVTAEFKDGVMTIRVPKSAHAKPKTIEVKVA
jgi:HSP20 family protein